MMVILPQVRVKATDLLMAKAVADISEASHSMVEARDLSIIHANFRIIDLREVHTRVTVHNPGSRNCAIFVHYVNSSELHL